MAGKYHAIRHSFATRFCERFPTFARVKDRAFGTDHVYEHRITNGPSFFLHLQISPKSWDTAFTLEMFWAEDGSHPGFCGSFVLPMDDPIPSAGRARVGLLWEPFQDYWWRFDEPVISFDPIINDVLDRVANHVMPCFSRIATHFGASFNS
ncbi:MAG: hypothetical protein ACYTGL_07500 [Planctomycetota bacterium]